MGQKLVIFLFTASLFGSCEMSAKKDLSLSLKEYTELGIPDYAHVWTPKDYEDAWQTLIQIKNKKPYSLPRKYSNKSGLIFNRLINIDNLSFIEEDSLQLFEKAYIIQSYIIIQGELIDVYTDYYRSEQYYNSELIALYYFGLAVTEKMLYLAYKINESDKKEDVAMKSAFPNIKGTYLNMLSNVLEKQKYASIYFNEDTEPLSDSISISIEKNKNWMDSSTLLYVEYKLQIVIDSTTSNYIKTKYQDLIESF